jgi:hypothetical protein
MDVRCPALTDDAYCSKHRSSAYLNPMIAARARAATVRIMPRETDGFLQENFR